MRRLKDFQCGYCGKVYERFCSDELVQMQCECGELAFPVIGMPTIKLEGITGDFPGAHAKWAKIREDNKKEKSRRSYSEP